MLCLMSPRMMSCFGLRSLRRVNRLSLRFFRWLLMLMPLFRSSDSIPRCRSAMSRMLSSWRWSAGMLGRG